GCSPSLSGILASFRLIATLSTVIQERPPACPTSSTMSGSYFLIASSTTSALLVYTVGISILIISAPAIVSGSSFTASYAGFTFSPPNGSNPVTTTFFVLTSFYFNIHLVPAR